MNINDIYDAPFNNITHILWSRITYSKKMLLLNYI